MNNLVMNIRRYKALVLALLPYPIVAFLLYSIEAAEGFRGIGYLIILIVTFPILTGMTVLSVVFAFSGKDPQRKLIRTTKVLSVISMTVFVGVCLIGAYGAITSMM